MARGGGRAGKAAAAAAAGCAGLAAAAGQEAATDTGLWWTAANAWQPQAAAAQPAGFNFFEAAQDLTARNQAAVRDTFAGIQDAAARNQAAVRDTFTGVQEAGQAWQAQQREATQATLEAVGLGPALQQIEQMRLATQAQMDAFRDATFALLEGAFPGVRMLPLAGSQANAEEIAAAGVTVRQDGAVCKTYSAESIAGLDSPTPGEVISTIVVPDKGTLVAPPVVTANIQHPRAGASWVSLRSHSGTGSDAIKKRVTLKKPCLKKDSDCPKGGKDLVGTVFTDSANREFFTDKAEAPFTGEVLPLAPLNILSTGNGYSAGSGGTKGRWVMRVKIPGKNVQINPAVQWDLTLCMAPDAEIATFDDIVEKDDAGAAAQAFTSAFSFPTPMVMPLNNFVGKFAASYGLAFTYAAIKHVVWHMKGEETTFELPKIETFDIEDWTHGWPTMMKELSGHMREAGKSALELSLGMLGHMHEAVRNFEMPKIQLPKFPVFNHFNH